MKKVKKCRDIKHDVTIEKKQTNYLVSESNYHTRKYFTEELLAMEIKKRDTYE